MNLQKALNEFRTIGGGLPWPFYLSLLAVLYELTGQSEKGLAIIDEAFAAAAPFNENWWNAELYRLRGKLRYQQGATEAEVEAAYQQAISLAREQAALSLELRATVSLAELWHTQGRTAEARQVLAAVYQQFTEGFATPDLQAAQGLLTALGN